MPVDTRNRRFSMVGLGAPLPRVLPDPDSAFGNADRSMLLYLYHEDVVPPEPPEPEPGDDMPTQGPKTAVQKILRAVRSRLTAILVEDVLGEYAIGAGNVFFSRIHDTPRWEGNADVVLRVTAPRPLPGFWEGHGEVAPGVTRGLIVEVRSRSSLDISDRVDTWLLSQQTVIEDAVTLALVSFRPVDPDVNPIDPLTGEPDPDIETDTLTIEGLSLTSGEEYKDTLARLRDNPDVTWGSSFLVFDLKYCVTAPDLPEVPE